MKTVTLRHHTTGDITTFNVWFGRAVFTSSTSHVNNVIHKPVGTLLSKVTGDMLSWLVSCGRVTRCALFSQGRRFSGHSEVRRESGRPVYTCQR